MENADESCLQLTGYCIVFAVLQQYARRSKPLPAIVCHPQLVDCCIIENYGPLAVTPVSSWIICSLRNEGSMHMGLTRRYSTRNCSFINMTIKEINAKTTQLKILEMVYFRFDKILFC